MSESARPGMTIKYPCPNTTSDSFIVDIQYSFLDFVVCNSDYSTTVFKTQYQKSGERLRRLVNKILVHGFLAGTRTPIERSKTFCPTIRRQGNGKPTTATPRTQERSSVIGLVQLYHNHIALKMPIFRRFPAILGVLWQNMNMESSGTQNPRQNALFCVVWLFYTTNGSENLLWKIQEKNACVFNDLWYANQILIVKFYCNSRVCGKLRTPPQ